MLGYWQFHMVQPRNAFLPGLQCGLMIREMSCAQSSVKAEVPSALCLPAKCALSRVRQDTPPPWAPARLGSRLPSPTCLSKFPSCSSGYGRLSCFHSLPNPHPGTAPEAAWASHVSAGPNSDQSHLCMRAATAFSLLPLCTFYRRKPAFVLTWGSGV